jgi:protein involved in polysaccharide export with SLBB domain
MLNNRPAGDYRRLPCLYLERGRPGAKPLLSLLAALVSVAVCCCAYAPRATVAGEPEPMPSLTQKTNVLKPNDVILVKVYQEEDLETKATIDKDGLITLPLLGTVEVGSRTPEQATSLIQGFYAKDYLVNPRVSLAILEHAKLRFTVMGQVQRPGTYEFPADEPLNLLQGIAMAGGYTRMGSPSKVSLQRMQKGQPTIYPLNADQMSKDKKTRPFEIMPDDIITVGERIF